MTRWAMVVDLDRCLGCEACMVACKTENGLGDGSFRLRMRQTVSGTFPELHAEFRPEACFHCDEPPCVDVCPTGATSRTEDGLVLVDPVRCTGCKACVTACPYGMRHVTAGGWVDKCSFCDHRLAEGREPACVETCPTEARIFGDLDSPTPALAEAMASAQVVKPHTGAKPKLAYRNSMFTNTGAETVQPVVVGHEEG